MKQLKINSPLLDIHKIRKYFNRESVFVSYNYNEQNDLTMCCKEILWKGLRWCDINKIDSRKNNFQWINVYNERLEDNFTSMV